MLEESLAKTPTAVLNLRKFNKIIELNQDHLTSGKASTNFIKAINF